MPAYNAAETYNTESFSYDGTAPDRLGLTDSATAFVGIFVAVTDKLGATEPQNLLAKATILDPDVSIQVTTGLTLGESDVEGLVDPREAVLTAARSHTDNLALGDSAVAVLTKGDLTDPAGITDAVPLQWGHVIGHPVYNTELPYEQNLLGTVTAGPYEPESMKLTDSVTVEVTYGVALAITDALGLSDSLARSQTVVVSDKAGLSDSVAIAQAKSVTITDALGVGDSAAASQSWRGTTTDAMGLVEPQNLLAKAMLLDPDVSIQVTTHLGFATTDAEGVTDSATGAAAAVATFTDAVGLVDSATPAAITRPSASLDPLGLADAAASAAAYVHVIPGIYEHDGPYDSPTAYNAGEGVGLRDSIEATTTATASVADRLGALDAVALSLTVTITDAQAVADTVSTLVERSVTDGLGLLDVTAARATHEVAITDELGLADLAARSTEVVDSSALIDSIEVVKAGLGEQVAILDNRVQLRDRARVTLTVTVTDTLGITTGVQAFYALLTCEPIRRVSPFMPAPTSAATGGAVGVLAIKRVSPTMPAPSSAPAAGPPLTPVPIKTVRQLWPSPG